MEADWDLHAVVRGCSATSTATVGYASSHVGTALPSQQDWTASISQELLSSPRAEPTSYVVASDLHDIYKPFYLSSRQEQRYEVSKQKSAAASPPSLLPISPLSVLNGLTDLSSQQQQQLKNPTQHITTFKQLPLQRQHLLSVSNGSKSSPRSSNKKRKNNMKKVCHVPMEKLSSDMWSWRKYGQKPIKGSPYPRGYYKCSTSKGCPARKQVERNRSDPEMFIVTYTSEHNHPMPTHRSSLAGTTRMKPSGEDPERTSLAASSLPEIPSPAANHSHGDHELVEADDDDLSASDVPVDDDFFAGLEDITGQECGSDWIA